MIVGIGLDIVEVSRIESAIKKWGDKFERRLFTAVELACCNHKAVRFQQLAGRFAAKEALFKALGTGLREGMLWSDVEVINDLLGKPEIRLRGQTKKFADLLRVTQILMSLTHTHSYAAAQVILISRQ
jgi:holo-[acyl-carrier protein] synthase